MNAETMNRRAKDFNYIKYHLLSSKQRTQVEQVSVNFMLQIAAIERITNSKKVLEHCAEFRSKYGKYNLRLVG